MKTKIDLARIQFLLFHAPNTAPDAVNGIVLSGQGAFARWNSRN